MNHLCNSIAFGIYSNSYSFWSRGTERNRFKTLVQSQADNGTLFCHVLSKKWRVHGVAGIKRRYRSVFLLVLSLTRFFLGLDEKSSSSCT
jgi:hypothetical protein